MPHPDPAPHTCPRCLGGVPNEEMRGQYPGAQSRTDNLTEVCSNCGTMEAIEQMGGVLRHQGEWPLAGGPTRSLQEILEAGDQVEEEWSPDDWEQFPHATNITETTDVINRRGSHDRIGNAIRRGYYGDDTHSGLAGDEWTGDDMNPVGPDYSQPDPFDTSDPEQAAQAENIEETEQLFSRWDEERDRNRRGL